MANQIVWLRQWRQSDSPKHSIGPHGHRAILLDSEGNRLALHLD